MATLVIDTNPHLKDEATRLQRMAKSLVSSFKIEGIELSFEEALNMIRQARKELKKAAE